ncbi:MAG: carboxypeptidase regulatory-like domain-containing protein, partial [Chitinophagaceae bacterium]
MRRLLILALLCPFLSMCQPLSLSGTVFTEEGEPVSGATVAVQRAVTSGIQTTTNDKGEFFLSALQL